MDLFLQSFVTLFVVVDPLGASAVFSVLMRGQTREQSRRTALRAALMAVILLTAFGLAGNALLGQLGVSVAAFRIAGGMLLFVTAFRMLMGFHDPDHITSEKSAYRDRTDVAIFPLTIPLLAGPGCMTAAMLHMTTAHTPGEKAGVIGAILAVEIIAFFCMLAADRLVRIFGASGSSLLARIMGVLMAAMAVQFVADGLLILWNKS